MLKEKVGTLKKKCSRSTLLIIKNQRLLHSREGFKPRSDGSDRWLARLFGMSTLERIVPAFPEFQHIGKD